MLGTYKPLQQELAEVGFDESTYGHEITCQEDAEALLDMIHNELPNPVLFDRIDEYDDLDW